MREVRDDVQRWLARGDRVALATVVATRRSAPRPVGAKLAISAQGELAGSVSGGCVENEVYEYAQEVLAGAPPRLLTYGISDDLALSVGLPCGGEIDVFVEEARRPLADRLMQIVESNERAVVLTVLAGDDLGAELLVTEDGERIGDAPEELAESAPELISRGRSGVVQIAGRDVFADVYGPPPRLLIYGAVDTAEALSRAAQEIGWQPIVADARARFATSERLPSAAEIVVAWPDETLAEVQPGRRNRDRHPHPRRQVRRPDDHRRARDQTRSTSARSAHGATRSVAASDCSKRESTKQRSNRFPAPAGSTSARRRRRRRRSRSWPRSWPSGPGARAAACASATTRIHAEV